VKNERSLMLSGGSSELGGLESSRDCGRGWPLVGAEAVYRCGCRGCDAQIEEADGGA